MMQTYTCKLLYLFFCSSEYHCEVVFHLLRSSISLQFDQLSWFCPCFLTVLRKYYQKKKEEDQQWLFCLLHLILIRSCWCLPFSDKDQNYFLNNKIGRDRLLFTILQGSYSILVGRCLTYLLGLPLAKIKQKLCWQYQKVL